MRLFLSGCCCLAAYCQPLAASIADENWQSVYAFSELKSVPFEKLARGEILGTRTALEGSELSLGAEFFYIVPLPPDLTLQKMKGFSAAVPTDAGTLSVSINLPLRNPASLTDFTTFKLDPGSAASLWFFRQSFRSVPGKGGFNLSRTERERLAESLKTGGLKETGSTQPEQTDHMARIWQGLLQARADIFQKSGLLGSEPYDKDGQHFEHAKETLRALRNRPKVLHAFTKILDPVMTGKDPASNPAPAFYWENARIREEQTLSLGALFSCPQEDGHQAADITYYVSSQYYLSLILYWLIPVEIEGKPSTFVYRSDFVLTPSVSRIKGIERIAAENILLMEIRKSIQSFVDSCETPPISHDPG